MWTLCGKKRRNSVTKARNRAFCRADIINLGFFDGKRVFPISVNDRENSLFLYNNQFCLIMESAGVSFNQALKELKDNFKTVDNYITEEYINSHFKYGIIPEKIESHLTNFITYDLETHYTYRARPYVFCFYRLTKLAGKTVKKI